MTQWEPSPKQQSLLEVAQKPGLSRTISAICAEADVSRNTFYEWLKEPAFAAAWEANWALAIRREMPGVIAAQMDKALDGDTASARFLAEMITPPKVRHEHTGKNGGPVEHALLTPEQWAERDRQRIAKAEATLAQLEGENE